MLAGNAVVFAQNSLGLIPEIFDAVDVMAAGVYEGFCMVDPTVAKPRDV